MNNNINNDQSSSLNLTSSSFPLNNTPTLPRRSSLNISSRTNASPASRSARGGVSKVRVSRTTSKSSKSKRTSRRRPELAINDSDNDGTDNDGTEEMEADDIDSSTRQHDNEESAPLNVSTASTDTVVNEQSNIRKKPQKHAIEYFLFIKETSKYKCSICAQEYKSIAYSDTNLRSHLGFKHGMHEYLFPSQLKQRADRPNKSATIASLVKQRYHEAAIQCIVDDGHAFGIFRRPGMQNFLATIAPGYRGPSRKTVRRNIEKLYQQHRNSLRETFKTIPFVALTLDLWMNSRRTYFLAITAHYYNNQMQYTSIVTSFRRFCGRHLSKRLNTFIAREIEKLGIETKIISITTDSGSDIKSATSSGQFGTRFSCDAHNINLVISSGLNLWKNSGSNKTKNAGTTTTSLSYENEQEFNEIRLVDNDRASDSYSEGISDNTDEEEESALASTSTNNNESSTENSTDSDEEDHEDYGTLLQHERQIEDQEQKELEVLLSNKEELKKKVHSLLKKTRKLVSLIRKSSILTSFVREEARRKEIELNSINVSNNEEKIKLNELVKDFYVRWSSTYLMISRLISMQQIINDITYTPQARIGLSYRQIRKLKSMTYSHLDWEMLQTLAGVLASFHLATRCLSARKYPTLAMSYWIKNNLNFFLSSQRPEVPIENALKQLLLERFKIYFESMVTSEEKNAKLIAAYLDPFTLAELSDEEINVAESLIISEASLIREAVQQTSSIEITSQLNQPQLSSSITTSSIPNARRSSLSTIEQFKNFCRVASATTTTHRQTSTPKSLSIKEELSMYVSTHKQSKDFESFWNGKQHLLPTLALFVRRYSVIPATSVASESAFSVAGYIQRKQRASLSPTTLRYLMLLKK